MRAGDEQASLMPMSNEREKAMKPKSLIIHLPKCIIMPTETAEAC